jgi:hypothetical protein
MLDGGPLNVKTMAFFYSVLLNLFFNAAVDNASAFCRPWLDIPDLIFIVGIPIK